MTAIYKNSFTLSSKEKTPEWKSSLNDIRGTLEANRGSSSVVEQIQTKQRETLNDRIRRMRLSLVEEPKKKKKFRMPTLAISKGTPIITALNNAQRAIDQRKSQTLPPNPKPLSMNLPEEDQLTTSSRTSSTLSISGDSSFHDPRKSGQESERRPQTEAGLDVSTMVSEFNSDVVTDDKNIDEDSDDVDGDYVGEDDGGDTGGESVILKLSEAENMKCVSELPNNIDIINCNNSPPHVIPEDETPPTIKGYPPGNDSPIFKSSLSFVPLKVMTNEPSMTSTSPTSDNQCSPIEFQKSETSNRSSHVKDSNKISSNHPAKNIFYEPSDYPTNTISYTRNCYQISLKNRPPIRAQTEPPGYPTYTQITTQVPKATQEEKSPQSSEVERSQDVREVVVNKGPFSLGFCIEGGKGSPLGDLPIRVKRLFKGDTSVKGILEPGDVIITVNGQPMEGLTHFQAWNLLKLHSEGRMKMVIKRERGKKERVNE